MKFWTGLQVCTVVTAVATVVALTQEPFVEPYVEKTLAEARLALDRALKGRLTPDWVGAELDAAVDREDLDRTELLLALVARKRIPVADSHVARARKYVEREKGILAISVVKGGEKPDQRAEQNTATATVGVRWSEGVGIRLEAAGAGNAGRA